MALRSGRSSRGMDRSESLEDFLTYKILSVAGPEMQRDVALSQITPHNELEESKTKLN